MEETKGLFGYLPVSFFGSVMGLSGLSIGWRLASEMFGLPKAVSYIIGAVALVTFIGIFIAYSLKIITNFNAFKKEFTNPLLRSFFGTFTISLLLLPIVIFPYAPSAAKCLWAAGVITMSLFALYVVSVWLGGKHKQVHVTPGWIIPVVGTLDIPLAYRLFDFSWGYDISFISLSVGLFFALPVFGLIMSRILFIEPMPEKLTPSLMILLAPFAVGFSAYAEVMGRVDAFALALYFIGLFLLFALVRQITKIKFCCPFRITWWAVSFPLSAMLVATLKVYQTLQTSYMLFFSIFFLISFTLIILWLFIRTLKGIFKGELKSIS